MRLDDFTRVALSLPEAVEGAHMGRTDFRIGNRIFASLHPDKDAGMVLLKPGEQAMLVEAEPATSPPSPAAGARAARPCCSRPVRTRRPSATP